VGTHEEKFAVQRAESNMNIEGKVIASPVPRAGSGRNMRAISVVSALGS
jgi:hypothetical protein